jgi:hypothetical protein
MVWAILLSIMFLSTQLAFGQQKNPKALDYCGGFDDIGTMWALTDENLDSLEQWDIVMPVWTGPDGVMDPPVTALGSPYNGWPTGDDEFIKTTFGFYDYIDEYSGFYFGVTTWDVGDRDSLGRQRHPTPGEKIYARVFNGNDLTTATHYGESNLYTVLGNYGELFYTEMPNDPPENGPTTDQTIYGYFFKIIGGINPTTGQSFPLVDSLGNKLEDGDLVQLIWTGADGQIDIPDPLSQMPSGDDELIAQWGMNEGMLPSTDTGQFRKFSASYDISDHGLPAQDQQVYVRLFNAENPLAAEYYGDSDLYTVQHTVGESLNVFYDGGLDCAQPVIRDTTIRDLTILGGWDPFLFTGVPLVNVFGLQLADGQKVHILWAGPDGMIDPLDETTGLPTGDDSLYIDGAVGDGIAGIDLGRFEYPRYSYLEHGKGGFPAKDDVLYARVFDGTAIGDDSDSKWYGESEPATVMWEFDEEIYFFPDTLFDATTRTPWYRTLKIFAGTDTAETEYPLTDSSGTQLEDGDLVQIIWAGPNGTVDPMGTTDCMPTGDDSLWATMAIGEEYGNDSGLFKTELQTFKTLHPGEGDILYLRIFNDDVYTGATHYGESEPHTVAYMQGETFHCFDDDAMDCVMPNPCLDTTAVEWVDPSAPVPMTYALYQNYPNPFNPETDIRYQIPEGGHVQLIIYNVLGQKVSAPVNGYRDSGSYTVRWFGTDQSGCTLGAGIYFYRLQAGDFSETRKMVLMK